MNPQASHTELTLYIPVHYKSFGLLEAKVMGVLNPVTFLAKRPMLPKDYKVGNEQFREPLETRTEFETRLTRDEELQLQALVLAIQSRIFDECYPQEEQL